MSAPNSCCCSGVDVEVINVPGVEGDIGSYAFTYTTVDFVVPATGTGPAFRVTASVLDNSWMSVGQYIFVEDAGVFLVISKTGSTQVVLEYRAIPSTNTHSGDTVAGGSQVSPSGPPPTQMIYSTADATPVGNVTAQAPAVWYQSTDITNVWFHINLLAADNTSWEQFSAPA